MDENLPKKGGLLAEKRRKALRDYMERTGTRLTPWAAIAKVSEAGIRDFFNGTTAGLNITTYEALAAAKNTAVAVLLGEDVPLVPVIGAVQAGQWSESFEFDEEDRYSVPILTDDDLGNVARFGAEVRGPSMNREYPEKTILVCVNVFDYPHGVGDGDHVIVRRVNDVGLVETTVKELRIDDEDRAWLWPKSDHPEHQAPIELPTSPNPDGESFTDQSPPHIVAVVVGAYKRRLPFRARRKLLNYSGE